MIPRADHICYLGQAAVSFAQNTAGSEGIGYNRILGGRTGHADVDPSPFSAVEQHARLTQARRVAGEALPMWQCLEAVAAEVLSAIPLETDPAGLAEADHATGAWYADSLPADGRVRPRTANGCAAHALAGDIRAGEPAAPPPAPELHASLRSLLESLLEGLESALGLDAVGREPPGLSHPSRSMRPA